MANTEAQEHLGQHLEFRQTGWFWCGCGGKPSTQYKIQEGTKMIIFVRATILNYEGKSGTVYLGRPNVIAMDVKSEDADEFIKSGQARIVQPGEIQNMTGYLAQV